MDIDIIKKLESIQKYDLTVDIPGCDCCGPSIDFDKYDQGEIIKVEEYKSVLEEVKKDMKRLLHLALATGSAHGIGMDQANAESWIKENLK